MNIHKTISDWANDTFGMAQCDDFVTIEALPAAPPFLFTENSGPGYCITITPPRHAGVAKREGGSPATRNPLLATAAQAQLGLWIPESGAQGSQCAMREGDVEISSFAVDWSKATRTDVATGEKTLLAHEDALVENLSALYAEFLRDEILLPALEKHLDDNGIAHEPFTIDMCSGIEPWDEKNWAFLFLPAEPITSSEPYDQPDWSTSRVLGLTGDGRAALFSYSRQAVDPRGYVDHINLESQVTGIDSPAALQSWLEDLVAATPA
ncbi:MAG: hypothetical protein ACKOHM_12780 [Spartobacteria bacterium]